MGRRVRRPAPASVINTALKLELGLEHKQLELAIAPTSKFNHVPPCPECGRRNYCLVGCSLNRRTVNRADNSAASQPVDASATSDARAREGKPPID